MQPERKRSRVLVHRNELFYGASLSSIVRDAGADVIVSPPHLQLGETLDRMAPPVALIVIPVYPDAAMVLQEIVATTHTRSWLRSIPILGLSHLDEPDLDLWKLRAIGLVGLIDRGALPEHVRFRVGQLIHAGQEGRRHERAPCCLPVHVDVAGELSTEYATSLSVGGMGLACQRAIEPNTDLRLRFALDTAEDEVVEAEARAIHARRLVRSGAEFEVGVFFTALSDRGRFAIGETVSRLQNAWASLGELDAPKPGLDSD